jgi:hypothetical protein
MPFEFRLMAEGYGELRKDERREAAGWVCYLLAPHLKEPVSVAQLLGEATSDEEELAAYAEAEKKYKRMMRKHRKAIERGV